MGFIKLKMQFSKFLLHMWWQCGNLLLTASKRTIPRISLSALDSAIIDFRPVIKRLPGCHFYVSGTNVATLVLFTTIIPIVAIIGVILANENNKIEMRLKNT